MHFYLIMSLISLGLISFILRETTIDIRKSKKSRVFKYPLISSIALIAVDIVWILSEINILILPILADRILGAAYYTLTGLAAYYCFVYSETMLKSDIKKSKKYVLILQNIPVVVLTLVSVLSIFTNWLFSVGVDGIHVRGPLYIIQPVTALLYPLITGIKAIYLTFTEKNPYNKNRYLSISMYCFVIIGFAVLQVIAGDFAFLSIGMMISTVHAYFFINTFEREQFTNYSKIKSFSQLFLSAYYLDMQSRTLERIAIADKIKNSDDFAEHKQYNVRPYDKAMNYYINGFVHPNDKEFFREMTTIDYIEENISEEKPYYVVNYRQVINSESKWYRLYVIATNVLDKNETGNAMICVMDVNQEQKLVAKSSYYKDMLTSAVATSFSKLLQVDVSEDTVYELKVEDGIIRKLKTGKKIEDNLVALANSVVPEYRESVMAHCRHMIERSEKNDVISYGYRGYKKGNESSPPNEVEYGWFVTTIRSIDYEGNRLLLIFVADNTDKIKSLELQEERRHVEAMNTFVVNVLSSAVEFRSMETGDHVNRVTSLTRVIISELMHRYPEYKINDMAAHQIANAAALHDLGKIAIPDNILLKPGKLTAEEFEEMKKHTIYGCDMLEKFEDKNSSFYKYCYEICRYHHERYDGKGYPEGLCGEDIPISAQIVSVVDVFDALTSNRSYKKAYSTQEAVNMINNGECGTFSPKILECFNAVVSAIAKDVKETV